jgi:hypothetical protein
MGGDNDRNFIVAQYIGTTQNGQMIKIWWNAEVASTILT